jgi:hypothetical protein
MEQDRAGRRDLDPLSGRDPALDRALRNWQPTPQVKATRKTRNLVPAARSCSPARRNGLSAHNLEAGKITYVYGEEFKPVR